MTNDPVIVTMPFTRAVFVHELRSGDVFTYRDGPKTPLTILSTEPLRISPELSLIRLTLAGLDTRIDLPPNLPIKAHRMPRAVQLSCLLCTEPVDVTIDVPPDGEPLTVVCGAHPRSTARGDQK